MTTQEDPAPMPDRPAGAGPSFWSVFPKVALPMFLGLSDQTIVATAMPSIAASLGAVEQVSLVVTGYLVAATIAAPVYGRLSDVFGRRRIMLVALGIFLSASLCSAFAANMPMLVGLRIVQGLGGGGLMALSHALVSDVVERRDRARYQGYLASVGVTSNVLGPIMGGLLTDTLGWRFIFVVNLPIGLLACYLISRLPRTTAHGVRARFDYVGLALFAGFVLTSFVLVQTIRDVRPDSVPLVAGMLVLAAGLLWLLIRVERRMAVPLVPIGLFGNPSIWRANAVAACYGGLLVSLITFMPLYLRIVHGVSASAIGLLLVPMMVGIGIGSMLTGTIIHRTGRTAIWPACGLTVVTASIVTIAAYGERLDPAELAAALGATAVFMGTVMTVVQVTVQAASGRAQLGAASASVQYSRTLGAAFVTALAMTALLTVLSSIDGEASALFAQVLEHGVDALQGVAAGRIGTIRAEFEQGFRAAFLVTAASAATASVLCWTIPIRRI